MKRRTAPILVSAGLVGALALVPLAASTQAAADTETYKELETFMGVFERVRANYVDRTDDHVRDKPADREAEEGR